MSETPDRPKGLARVLAADARQGLVGAAAVGVLTLGAGLASRLGGSVSIVVLVIVVGLVLIAAGAVVAGTLRRADRLKGQLDEVRAREAQSVRVAEEARAQISAAATPADGSPAPMSLDAQGFVRRLRTLRTSAQQVGAAHVTDTERSLMAHLLRDMRVALPEDRTLGSALDQWVRDRRGGRQDLFTTLDALEALATNYGIEQAASRSVRAGRRPGDDVRPG